MAKDDFNFDEMDWPDLNFDDPAEPSNDRKPVSKATKNVKKAAKGAASAVADEQRIRKLATKILPGRHSDVADAAFDLKDLLKEAGGELGSEAAKTKREMQMSLRRFNRETKGMFPDKIAKLLEKMGGQEESYYGRESEQERRRQQTDATLTEVFGEIKREENEEKRERAAKELRGEVLQKRRYQTQLQLFASIDNSLKRVSAHSDIDLRFKRKQLELQLQQNILTGDLVEGIGGLRKDLVEELRAVVKNTALPEAAKIELTEEFKRVNAQKLLEKLGGGMYGGLGDYLARTGKGINKRLTGSVAGKLREWRSNATGALDATGEMLRMQREMQESGADDDTIETIMQLASGLLMDKGINKYGGGVKSWLGNRKFFKGTSGKADNAITQGAQYLNWQAGRRGTHDGAKGQALDFLRSLLDRTSLNPSVRGFVGVGDLNHDDPKLKRLSLKTIVNIIPGLLARIHHEAVKTRTGDDSVPMIRYNLETGSFTDSRTMISSVRDSLVSKGTAGVNNEAMDRIMANVVDTSKLTGSQKTLLRNHLTHLNMRQLPFDPSLITTGAMPIFGEGSTEDKIALKRALSDKYGLDTQGKVSGSMNDYHQKVADSAKQIKLMQHNLKDPRKEVLELIEKGHAEELIALGVLKDQNGQMQIDFDRVNAMRFDETLGGGADLLGGAFAPKGMRALRGGKVINNILNTTNQNNSLTSIRGTKGGWGKEDAYNSQYQSMALEEIIDVLKEGQLLNKEQMENLSQAVKEVVNDPEGRTYAAQYQTMVLEEIMDILQDGRQYANIGNAEGMIRGAVRRVGGFMGNMKRSAMSKFNKGKDFLKNTSPMRMFRGARDFVKDRFNKNRDFVKGKYEKVRDKVKEKFSDVQDWYRDGEWRPALEARKLAARKYIDEKTGLAVEKLSEVKGDILELMEDGSTRVAVAYEELREGLRTMGGRKFIVTKFNAAKDWVGNKIDKALGRHRAIKDRIVGAVKSTYGRGKSFLFGLPDVYVKGEVKPRMLAVMAKQGAYQNIDGDEVRTLNDIKGEVRNRNFEMVLSEDDIKLGLVDADGNDLSMFAPGLKGLVQRLLSAPGVLIKKIRGIPGKFGNMMTGAKTRVKRAFKGLGGLLKGFTGGIMGALRSAWNTLTGSADSPEEELLNVAYAQLEVQGNILDQVVALRKKGRKGKWDSDGDGIIDGSWRDLLSRRKSKEKAKKEEAEKGEKEDSPLMKMLKNAFSVVGGVFGTGIKAVGTVIWDAIVWLGALLLGKTGLDSMLRRMPGGRVPGGPGGHPGRAPGKNPGRRPNSRRVPGKGKAAIFGTLLAGLGLGGYAMSGDGDVDAGGSEYLDTPEKNKPSAKTTPKANPASQVAKQTIKARLMAQLRGTAMRTSLRFGGRALMNPYVLGAAVIAGSYMYYDYRKPRLLQHARLTQYGVNRDDTDMAPRYLSFEQWVIDNAKIDGSGKVSLGEMSNGELLDAMEEHIGGAKTNVSKALTWFDYRFMPVLGGWMSALSSFKRVDQLVRIDDAMSSVQARDLFKVIRKIPADSRSVPLVGTDKVLSASVVEETLTALDKKINDAAGKVKEGDGSSGALAGAGLANALAVAKGDTEITSMPGGKVMGWAANVNPVFMLSKTFTGYFQGLADQYSSAKGLANLADLKIEKGPVDPLRAVRMKVYGLVDLDIGLVNALIKLEAMLIPDVKYSGRNTAVYRGNSKAVLDVALADFGVSPKDPESLSVFTRWFETRFMPSFLTYLGAAHEAKISDPLRAHTQASFTQQYHAANAMVGASTIVAGEVMSVWRTALHPVLGKRPNADPASVGGNMETLLAKVDQSELSEISGEKGNVLTSTTKKAASLMSRFSELKNKLVNKASSFLPSSVGNKIKSWFGGETSMTSGGQTPTSPWSGLNRPGGSYTPSLGDGAMVNFDPAGGKYGNVNDVPLPTAPKGFEAHMDLIAVVAKMTGVDPGILAGLFATESSFDSRAKPGTSSAKGLGQFIDTTWTAMVRKYGHLFGIKEGTSPNDPRANALMTVMYMKDNAEELKRRLGKQTVTDVDLYLAHFLGPHGYEKLYKNPNGIAANLLPDAASSNAPIFYDNGRARTAAEVMQIQANKQIRNRGIYGPQMHAYVKSKGGTVDPAALAGNGGQNMDMTQMGQQPVSPSTSTEATPEEQYDELGFGGVKSPVASPVLTIDGGGVPNSTNAGINPGAAGVVRTAAQAGSDITAPPPTSMSADSAAAVQQAAQSRNQTQVASVAKSGTDGTGQELVRIGTMQVNLLQAINQGIETLVKLSGNIQKNPPPVNGLPAKMPMSLSKPSSV